MVRQRWWSLGLLVAIGVQPISEARAEDIAAPNPPARIDGWGWAVDPDASSTFRVDQGKLTIVAPGPVQDMSIELGRMNAPRTARKVKGDFIAQVKVSGSFAPGTKQGLPVRLPYHGAGLLLMHDLETYVRIDRAAVTKGALQQHYVSLQTWSQGNTIRPTGPWSVAIKESTDVYLRLERRGNVILGAIAVEPGNWHYFAPQTAPLPAAVWIGVSGVNVSGENFEPQFEQFEVLQPTEAAKPKQNVQPDDLPPGADGNEPPAPIGGFPVAATA